MSAWITSGNRGALIGCALYNRAASGYFLWSRRIAIWTMVMPNYPPVPLAMATLASILFGLGEAAVGQIVTDHIVVEQAGEIDGKRAEALYQQMRAAMQDRYALSGEPTAARYQRWTRHNTHPFPSATHGNRFINHYVNALATDYGMAGHDMPVGAIIAKDALTVMDDGSVYPGPLAIMEKMPAGFDPAAGDWRYIEILPDGSALGSSDGQNRDNIQFCVDCHNSAPDGQDRLFFVPERWRR